MTSETAELISYCRSSNPQDIEELLRGLSKWGKLQLTISAFAAATEALPNWTNYVARVPQESSGRATDALSAVAAWISCPCDRHLEIAAEARSRFTVTSAGLLIAGKEGQSAVLALESALAALDVASSGPNARTPVRSVEAYVTSVALRSAIRASRAAACSCSDLPQVAKISAKRLVPSQAAVLRVCRVMVRLVTLLAHGAPAGPAIASFVPLWGCPTCQHKAASNDQSSFVGEGAARLRPNCIDDLKHEFGHHDSGEIADQSLSCPGRNCLPISNSMSMLISGRLTVP